MDNEQRDVVVIIPAYEPPKSLVGFVKALRNGIAWRVIVVNDGSPDKYNGIFEQVAGIDGCTLLSHDENRGKGCALKTAFAYCLGRSTDEAIFVTADCDGRYLPEDVAAVAAMAGENPYTVVLGTSPSYGRKGEGFMRKALKALYGIDVGDTATGLRAFDHRVMARLAGIYGNRFEYETNMLIELHKNDIGIAQCPISAEGRVNATSHFRTFKDGARVIAVVFKSLDWYILSSLLSAATDVGSFWALSRYVFTTGPESVKVLLATVSARLISSALNFKLNNRFVFHGRSRTAAIRYYILWLCQLGCSYLIAYGWDLIFPQLIAVTGMKAVSDVLLAAVSYQIQLRWVFRRDERDRLRFYGGYARKVIAVANLFSKKYSSNVQVPEGPAVYISRHLNMHGPYTICRFLGFDVHPLVLHNFFTYDECKRQYSDYTFTERYHRKGVVKCFARFFAGIAASAVPPLIRSIEAIPVYRGSSRSITTFRRAMEYIMQNESVAVFPDIDYTAEGDTEGDFYNGFLFLDRLYFRKTGRHIDFVPLRIDDAAGKVIECPHVRFREDVVYKDDSERVYLEIKAALAP